MICTNLEQSNRLIKAGIDPNTADMCYTDLGYCKRLLPLTDFDSNCEEIVCNAWSLSALLELFDNKAGIVKEYDTWFAYDNEDVPCTKNCDNPIDAAFEMVVRLKENKII